MLDTIWQEAIYAIRALRKSPYFAGTAVLILALGIGGNTAMFAVIRAVLLKPLNYRDPDRLVQVSGGATPTRFEELKSEARSFAGVAAFSGEESLTLSGGPDPEALNCVRASAGFLNILGVSPLLGRSFLPAEDSGGAPNVVMISARLWKQRFNEDPQVAGRTVTLGATRFTIIGVLPRGFQFPFSDVDAWMTRPSEWGLMAPQSRMLSPFLTVFGRLKPQVSMEQANAEMAVIHRRYAESHPAMLDAKSKSAVEVSLWKDRLVGNVRVMLWILFGAVGFVLLITCGNVASLMLARAAARTRELAIRSALGASGTRLVGQLLAESILLAMAGGVMGVLVAAWSLQGIHHLTAFDLPRAGEVHLDWAVFLFAATASIVTGVLFGLTPSLGASRPDLMQVLRGSGQAPMQEMPGRIFGRISSRSLLVVGQVALSFILLIGAALMLQSLIRLHDVDVGFNPANLLTVRVSLPLLRYDTEQKKATFFSELVERARQLPGVRSATAAMFFPMTGYVGSPVQDASKPLLRLNERQIATLLIVAPAYFRTLQIPMRRGRDFDEQDKIDAERVAIIDEATARRFWPAYPGGLDPVGQHLLIGGVNKEPARIIGIVAGIHQNLEKTAWPETVYLSFAQAPQASAMLAVRSEGNPRQLVSAIRQQVRTLDRDQPISDVRTMEDLIAAEMGQRHLIVLLLASFASIAMLLALIGLYGLISYSVTQRVQELGIRSALGAQQGELLRLVISQGLGLTLAGIVIGMTTALAVTRALMSLLFQINATDPATYIGIGVLFAIAGLVASYIPARRAARVNPMAALRV